MAAGVVVRAGALDLCVAERPRRPTCAERDSASVAQRGAPPVTAVHDLEVKCASIGDCCRRNVTASQAFSSPVPGSMQTIP